MSPVHNAPAVEQSSLTINNPANHLAKLEQARQTLAECRTLSEVKKIHDLVEAAKVYAKAAHLGREMQNYAGEIALLAARKAGELVQQLDRKPGQRTDKPAAKDAGGSEYSKTLKETGTPERTAQRWQEIAAVPQDIFTAYVKSITPTGNISAAGLLKAAAACRRDAPHKPEPEPDISTLLYELTNYKINRIEGDAYARLVETTVKKLKPEQSDRLNTTIETLQHAARVLATLAETLQKAAR